MESGIIFALTCVGLMLLPFYYKMIQPRPINRMRLLQHLMQIEEGHPGLTTPILKALSEKKEDKVIVHLVLQTLDDMIADEAKGVLNEK